MSKIIKTIILCGGQGTRIRDVADDIPKPLIQIGQRPILWHVMKIYAHYDIKDFVLCLGYKGWLIKEFFLNYQRLVSDISLKLGDLPSIEYHNSHPETDWTVTLAETGLYAQTGARLWRIREYVAECDIFCVTYGDGVANVDIKTLIEFHRSHGKIGTVTGVRPTGRFGVLDTYEENHILTVKQFSEKPQSLEGLINGGFFVFDQRLWQYLQDDDTLIFEREPLMQLSKDNQLAVYEHTGFWQPMDTYREWKQLNQQWQDNIALWKVWDV